MSGSRKVLLFRSGDESDPYEEALAEAGYTAVSVPVLEFEFVHSEELREALEHPRSYDGLIFTSPRAVEAVASAMSWLPTENIMWHSKPIFAAGPKTAAELRQIGFEPTGERSGSADMLLEHITACEFKRPLLFLCGNRRRDELPDALRQAAIDFEELCVYQSHPKESLDLTAYADPAWVVFFSPSGVQAVRDEGRLDLNSVRIAAIGKTTGEALKKDGFRVEAIARSPTPDAVAEALAAADAPLGDRNSFASEQN